MTPLVDLHTLFAGPALAVGVALAGAVLLALWSAVR